MAGGCNVWDRCREEDLVSVIIEPIDHYSLINPFSTLASDEVPGFQNLALLVIINLPLSQSDTSAVRNENLIRSPVWFKT